jgi:hypothetical protein
MNALSLWHFCAAKQREENGFGRTLSDKDKAVRHYIGAIRYLFYREGIRQLQHVLLR